MSISQLGFFCFLIPHASAAYAGAKAKGKDTVLEGTYIVKQITSTESN